MKKFFDTIAKFLYSLGKIKTAATFARIGRPDLAKKVMSND